MPFFSPSRLPALMSSELQRNYLYILSGDVGFQSADQKITKPRELIIITHPLIRASQGLSDSIARHGRCWDFARF